MSVGRWAGIGHSGSEPPCRKRATFGREQPQQMARYSIISSAMASSDGGTVRPSERSRRKVKMGRKWTDDVVHPGRKLVTDGRSARRPDRRDR